MGSRHSITTKLMEVSPASYRVRLFVPLVCRIQLVRMLLDVFHTSSESKYTRTKPSDTFDLYTKMNSCSLFNTSIPSGHDAGAQYIFR